MELALHVGGAVVTASVHGEGATALVLGHGAGGTRRTPFLLRFADRIVASGRTVMLPDFPYSAAGRRIPDRHPVLEDTFVVAARTMRERGASRVVLGGKSMGGRMASQAAAHGVACDGLVFLGYPLHAPGKEDSLRTSHLPGVPAPMLFVQGTRDAFARFDLITAAVASLGERARMQVVEDGDHSFLTRRRSGGAAPADVEAAIAAGVVGWLESYGL